jgi:hypothetical protein
MTSRIREHVINATATTLLVLASEQSFHLTVPEER